MKLAEVYRTGKAEHRYGIHAAQCGDLNRERRVGGEVRFFEAKDTKQALADRLAYNEVEEMDVKVYDCCLELG
jgi:hypothetical protein